MMRASTGLLRPRARSARTALLESDETGIHYAADDILFSLVVPTMRSLQRAVMARTSRPSLAIAGWSTSFMCSRYAMAVAATYDVNCYAAFVLDPDGNKIEAVTLAAR